MLTAIGLATARRLRVGGAHSASHAARLALRVSARSAIVVPSSLRIAAVFKRSFAAARTVRAPKSGATGKTTKKTTTAATKTKAKKKPAAAKAKKPKTAKKAKKVKKKAPVKAKKPKKAKKVLTEEEKKKLKIKKLRQDALLKEQPSELPSKGWQVFVVSKSKDATAGTRITDVMKNLSQQYKALSPADKAALEAAAKRNKAANDVALASWITTRTADEIATANRARATLRRLGFKSKFRLHDPRAGPAKLGPYIVFSKERWASGDFATTTAVEASRKIGREWKALSDTEREAYRRHENVV